jgi:hypothetical protein
MEGKMHDEDLYVFVELKQKSFDKYIKARADVDSPGWHKLSNRLLEDDDLFILTGAEVLAWVYIMSQSSLQKCPLVRLNLDKVDGLKRRFSRQDLFNAIRKLRELGILAASSIDVKDTNPPEDESQNQGADAEKVTTSNDEPGKTDLKPEPRNVDVPPTLRARNVDVPLDGIGIGEDKELGRKGNAHARVASSVPNAPPKDPPSQPDLDFGEGPFTVAAEIQAEPTVRFVASQVPPIRQREWLRKHGPKVFNDSFAKAIAKKLLELKTEDPRRHKDWLGYLENWFKREQVVAFVPNLGTPPRPARAKDPPAPWPAGAKDRALRGKSVLDAFHEARGRCS